MKIVVIGGTGLIGSKLVQKLEDRGHDAVPASLDTGVNTITGEGLVDVMKGADVVVDVSNAPVWEDAAVLDFFQTSTRNLLAAERTDDVKHHVILSVVGADRMPDSGYMRAKVAQEDAVKAGGIPYTILRASQFFEFIGRIADSGSTDGTIKLTSALMQPEAADDVAEALAEIAVSPPVNGTVEIGGPEQFRMDDLVRRFLAANDDPRVVETDVSAPYFGAVLDERSLVPNSNARVAPTRLEDWLGASVRA